MVEFKLMCSVDENAMVQLNWLCERIPQVCNCINPREADQCPVYKVTFDPLNRGLFTLENLVTIMWNTYTIAVLLKCGRTLIFFRMVVDGPCARLKPTFWL